MSRFVLCVLGVLLLSANAWAIPTEGESDQVLEASALEAEMCLLLQDPWQDCDEDPWQLTSARSVSDTCLDPWQDAEDPWQPVPAPVVPLDPYDPWQPLISQLELMPTHEVMFDLADDDPWQPTFEDPWQEGDPWQVIYQPY
jgi:hypothetical protein